MKCNNLLREGENFPPKPVVRTSLFFEERNISYRLCRNDKAYGCLDASQKRIRDKMPGIPIEDELKTLFCRYKDKSGKYSFCLINCQSDSRINFKKIKSILGAKTKPSLLDRRILESMGLGIGIINSFNSWDYDLVNNVLTKEYRLDEIKIVKLFEESLQNRRNNRTMFTNAGNLTWAVEFNAKELVTKLNYEITISSFIY